MKLDLAPIIQLAASGNSRTVEELWMAALDAHAGDPAEVASWAPLAEELAKRERTDEGEALAWAAIEAVLESAGPEAALQVAGPFLLVLNQSSVLKAQVAELYARVYAERENLDVLLEQSGIAGGRPPRRALRTLEVCLNLQPGAAMVARDREEAARVVSIDADTWEVTVETRSGPRTLGPMELADEYAVADPDDFRVLQQFAPDRLRSLLEDDPAQVVISILRAHGDRIDSNTLAARLTPHPLPEEEWPKWWSKARTVLRRHPNIQIEGRSPYEISYNAEAVTLESETEARFRRLHDPLELLACLETYLRECRGSGTHPDLEMLARCRKRLDQAAHRQIKAGKPAGLTTLLAARSAALMTGVSEADADRPAVDFLSGRVHAVEPLKTLTSVALWPVACRCLRKAYPDRYLEICADLLPHVPAGACDVLAGELHAGGFGPERWDALLQRILKDPTGCVSALAWLWAGPAPDLEVPVPPLPSLCAKLLSVAGEIRRRDELPREEKKHLQNCVRDALSANQYAKFKTCLAQTDPGLAAIWRTQIVRLDNLGRAVPEDLAKLIRDAFPEQHRPPQTSPWKREDRLYMTSGGIQRLSAEMEELVNVKMRANSRAIGEAAAHGDLSENSEYKFALEERDLLRARLAQLQEQRSQAVLLGLGEVPDDHVGFGTRVTLRNNGNGQEFQMTFLGPWEANLDRDIYNYKSPVGQNLMGLRVGDTADLSFAQHPGVHTIVGIENALQPGEKGPGAIVFGTQNATVAGEQHVSRSCE